MRVWRLEDDEGRGPYQSLGERFGRDTVHEFLGRGDKQHPTPDRDASFMAASEDYFTKLGYVDTSRFFFGFANLKQLHAWFNPEQRKILKERYQIRLNRYSVPATEALIGDHQIAFNKSRATLVPAKEKARASVAG